MAPLLRSAAVLSSLSLVMWGSPSQARFLQVDPVGYQDQFNLYAYVRNDPMNQVDSDGQVTLPLERTNPSQDWSQRMARSIGDGHGRSGGPVTAAREGIGAASDFGRNYSNMREANTIGADKYFHCTANCEASSRGDIGTFVAERLSNAREIVDQRLGGDPPEASQQDQRANIAGRAGGDRVRQTSR